jgi:hypothetical protein
MGLGNRRYAIPAIAKLGQGGKRKVLVGEKLHVVVSGYTLSL